MSLEFSCVDVWKRRDEIVARLDMHFFAGRWLGLIGNYSQVKQEVRDWCSENMKSPYTFSKFNTEAITDEHVHIYFTSDRDAVLFKLFWF